MLLPLLSILAPCLPAPSPGDLLRERGGRPELSGPSSSEGSDDGRFRVHWTGEGEDAVPPLDSDGNGRADYLDRVFGALELGAETYAGLGFRAVPPDAPAPDGALDVYLRVLPVNGYAFPEPGPDGMSCFLQIDPGLGTGGAILESVVIHELHHCVQYAYTVAAASWIYEAAATHEQYEHVQSAALQGALDVLWNDRLRGADRPLDEEDGRFEYAAFLLIKFLTERGGFDRSRAVGLWEALESQPAWRDALDALSAADWGDGLDDLLLDFHTWNAFACARDDGAHYRADRLACTFPATSIDVEAVDGDIDLAFAEGRWSARYAEIAAGEERPVALDCSQDVDGAEVRLRLVAVDPAGLAGEAVEVVVTDVAELRLREALDPEGAVLVVAVAGEVAPHLRCAVTRADVAPEPTPAPPEDDPSGEACGCSDAPGGRAGHWLWIGLLALALRGRCRSSRSGGAC